METAYHSGCGGGKLGGSMPPHLPRNFVSSFLLDRFRQISIDYSEKFYYTDYRTNVCVYRGVHYMEDCKENNIELLKKLTANQIKVLGELTANQLEYLCCLAEKLFGKTVN